MVFTQVAAKSSAVLFKIPQAESKLPQITSKTDAASPLTLHDAIKPAYYVLKSVALWPYRYKEHNKIEPLNAKDKFLACSIAITTAIYYCYSTYFRMKISFIEKYPALSINDTVYSLSSHFLFFLAVWNSNSKRGCLTEDFLLCLEKASPFGTASAPELRKSILRQTIAIFVAGVFFNLFNIITSLFLIGVSDLEQYLSIYAVQFFNALLFLKINAKVEMLFLHFREVNGRFESCTNSHRKLRELSEIHAKLCNLINLTSEAHGWEIVLSVMAAASKILHSIHLTILYVVRELQFEAGMGIKVATRVAQISTTVYYCGLIIFLAVKCSKTKKEACKIGLLANDMLLKIPSDEKDSNALLYEKELNLIINQITYRQPNFSAVGIFNVDYTIISTVSGVVISYFVVLLQLPN